MSERVDLSVCAPCYNESATVADFVRTHADVLATLESTHGITTELVVVDDGSADDTPALLDELAEQEPRLRVIHHAQNQGIARTLATAYGAVVGRWVINTSPDGQWPADNVRRLWDAKVAGRHDVVVGVREDKAAIYTPYRLAVSHAYNHLTRWLCGVRIADGGGMKLGPRRFFQAPVQSTSVFADAERVVIAHDRGWDVGFATVAFQPRSAGRASGGRPAVVAAAAADLLRVAWRLRTRGYPSAPPHEGP